MKEHILVVDDEEDILELVRYNLTREGFEVTCATTGEEGLKLVESAQPHLLILDIMLPGINGLDVCKRLKNDDKTKDLPIIMLSARGEEADIVTGLELGADDYIAKPFSPRIMLARVRAVMRRQDLPQKATEQNGLVEVEKLTINVGRHEVLREGEPIELTATEFRILHLLASRRGWVFTRNQIITSVHGDDYPVTDRSVDVQITGLRKKLGSYGEFLETVRGVGYRFRD